MLRHRMSLALAHILDATSWDVSCGVGVGLGWGGVGDVNVPCTCAHGRCYAIGCLLHLHTYLMLLEAWVAKGQQSWPLSPFQVSRGSIGNAKTFRQTRT